MGNRVWNGLAVSIVLGKSEDGDSKALRNFAMFVPLLLHIYHVVMVAFDCKLRSLSSTRKHKHRHRASNNFEITSNVLVLLIYTVEAAYYDHFGTRAF